MRKFAAKILSHLIFSKDDRKLYRQTLKQGAKLSVLFTFMLRPLFKFLDLCLPKQKHKVIFISIPDFSDNTKAFYEYMNTNHKDDYELIWLYEKLDSVEKYNRYTTGFFLYSLKGCLNLLTAQYIVLCQNNRLDRYINPNHHIILQLWHGMPIKTVGHTERNLDKNLLKRYTFYGQNAHFFVTSDIFKYALIACFEGKASNFHITGQPRTDLCFSRNKYIEELLHLKKYKKVILYLPTYKEAERSGGKDIDSSFNNIFYMNDYKDNIFNTFLQSEDILFVLKPHPLDEKAYQYFAAQGMVPQNVKMIFNNDLADNNLSINQLFAYADLLVTDFSSVAIDFMVLDKPIVFISSLLDEYSLKRGLMWENYHRFLLGDKVSDFTSLMKSLRSNLQNDGWKSRRDAEISLIHKFRDAQACARVYDVMRGLIKK